MPGRTPGARLVTATGEEAQETHVSSEIPVLTSFTLGKAGLGRMRDLPHAEGAVGLSLWAGCTGQRLPGIRENSGHVQEGKSFPSWSQQSSYASRSSGKWSMGHIPTVTPHWGAPSCLPKGTQLPCLLRCLQKPGCPAWWLCVFSHMVSFEPRAFDVQANTQPRAISPGQC